MTLALRCVTLFVIMLISCLIYANCKALMLNMPRQNFFKSIFSRFWYESKVLMNVGICKQLKKCKNVRLCESCRV